MNETPVTITLADQQLLGIIHHAEGEQNGSLADTAVLIVVGGPQYRVGSHRQFIQLARSLASNGICTMRFDCRGMGDSEGEKVTFDNVCIDIKAAIDTLQRQQPKIKKIVIWGLCDAASVALIYAHKDKRVAALVLLNPWLRSDQAMGKTMVKYYYVQRLLSRDFWIKLLSGKVNVLASASDAKGFVADSVKNDQKGEASYQIRMLNGAKQFNGPVCLILSENDLTAREFSEQVKSDTNWQAFVENKCQEHQLDRADHTFSSLEFKNKVAILTADFIKNNVN